MTGTLRVSNMISVMRSPGSPRARWARRDIPLNCNPKLVVERVGPIFHQTCQIRDEAVTNGA